MFEEQVITYLHFDGTSSVGSESASCLQFLLVGIFVSEPGLQAGSLPFTFNLTVVGRELWFSLPMRLSQSSPLDDIGFLFECPNEDVSPSSTRCISHVLTTTGSVGGGRGASWTAMSARA